MKSWKNIVNRTDRLWPVLVIVVLIALWDAVVWLLDIDRWLLPRPHHVVLKLFTSFDLIAERTLETLAPTGLGIILAMIVSVVAATCMDRSERIRRTLYPLLVVSQSIPYFVVAPLFLIWFGFGIGPKVLVVMLVCLFPLTVNLADGYRQVDPDMLRMLKSMGASRWQLYKMVKLPGALPYFFSGLKIAGTYSVLGAVISELLGGNKGLGIVLIRSMRSFEVELTFATIVVIVLLSLAIYGVVQALARLAMPWSRERDAYGK